MVAGQMVERGAAARPPSQQPRLVGRDLDHLVRCGSAAVRCGRHNREGTQASSRGRPSPDDDDGALQQVGRGEYVRLPKKVTGYEHAPQTSARPGLAPGGGGADAAAGEVAVVEATLARRGAARRRGRHARPALLLGVQPARALQQRKEQAVVAVGLPPRRSRARPAAARACGMDRRQAQVRRRCRFGGGGESAAPAPLPRCRAAYSAWPLPAPPRHGNVARAVTASAVRSATTCRQPTRPNRACACCRRAGEP